MIDKIKNSIIQYLRGKIYYFVLFKYHPRRDKSPEH